MRCYLHCHRNAQKVNQSMNERTNSIELYMTLPSRQTMKMVFFITFGYAVTLAFDLLIPKLISSSVF